MRCLQLLSLLLMPSLASAEEGLWLPGDVQTALEQLGPAGADVDAAALGGFDGVLGAVVELPYCSGAFVSPDGLIATAYHCIWENLRYASEDGENLVEDGFYAADRTLERYAGPETVVRITESMTDVTEQVLAGVDGLEGEAATKRIKKNERSLVGECEDADDVHCTVVTFDGGMVHRLVRQKELRDVRVVYSPPRSIGYFGGRHDNWSWPRHSADFAFLRVYGSDGQSLGYDPHHTPYTPAQHLTPAAGPSEGEFVAVVGYPGQTKRWASAAQLEYEATVRLPERNQMLDGLYAVLDDVQTEHPDLGAKVQTSLLGIDNRRLFYEGSIHSLAQMRAVDEKWALEGDLDRWIVSDPERAERWGAAIERMRSVQAEEARTAARMYVAKDLQSRSELLYAALRVYKYAKEARKRDKKREEGYQSRDQRRVESWLAELDKRYDPRMDQPTLRYLLMRGLTLPDDQRIPELDIWFGALPHEGDLVQRLDRELTRMYATNTALTQPAKRADLLEATPFELESMDDPWLALAARLTPFLERERERAKRLERERDAVTPVYLQAMKAFLMETPDARTAFPLYPDANGTLRVSVGTVRGYEPEDGMVAKARTSARGIASKAEREGYDASDELLSATSSGSLGSYRDDELGSVPVNFISTTDTVAGNSGAATVDAKGRWVGVLFDGNEESMSSDWIFDVELMRSIHTDSTFVFWYLDAIAGADELLTELGRTPSLGGDAKPKN